MKTNVVITRVRAWCGCAYIMRLHAVVHALADINTASPDATMRYTYQDRASPQVIIHACVRANIPPSRKSASTRPSPSAWEALERQTDAVSHTDKPMALYCIRGPPVCALTVAPVNPLPAFDKPADVYAVAIRRAPPSFAGDRFIRRH